MQWLCRLVCPVGGVILDPFLGSGSTGCAAIVEGMSFVGIEQNIEYADVAVGRLKLALRDALPSSFVKLWKGGPGSTERDSGPPVELLD